MYINIKKRARVCVSCFANTGEDCVYIQCRERERYTCAHLYTLPPHPHNTLPISNKYAIHTHTHTQKYTTMCIYIYAYVMCVLFFVRH